ncbi:MAG: hypothetical protein AB7P22_08810 [Vicinamibacterales bacterium]
MRTQRLLALCLAVIFAAAACQGPVDPSENVIDEFSGRLNPDSQNDHFITIGRYGEFTLRVKSLTPSEGAIVFVILGIVQGGLCSIQGQNSAGHDQLVLAGAIQPAEYCIQVLDLEGLEAPVDYVLEFSHP